MSDKYGGIPPAKEILNRRHNGARKFFDSADHQIKAQAKDAGKGGQPSPTPKEQAVGHVHANSHAAHAPSRLAASTIADDEDEVEGADD
jgi:hypothetical protein